MSGARRVVRNSLFGIAAEAVGGVLSFVIIILIARGLGATQFGHFSYVLAFTGVFQLIADFGLTNIVVKEISRAREDTVKIVGAVKPLVWLFSVIIFTVIALLGYALSPTQEIFLASVLMGAAVLVTFHAVLYGSICRAHEEMGYNAIAFITHKFILLGLVLTALHGGHGLVGLSLAYLLSNLYQWAFFYVVTRRRYLGGPLRWHKDAAYWKYLIGEALPVGLAMVFRRATLHVDTLILTALAPAASVGLFNAAYRIVQIVDMIPFTLSIPLFPPFTRMARDSLEGLYAMLNNVLRIFMLIAAPTAFLVYWFAQPVMELAYGADYLEGVATLQLIAGVVLLLFPTSLFLYLFTALGKQRLYTLSAAACLGINAVVDVMLIPSMGHMGAAIGTLVAEITFFLVGGIALLKLGFRPRWHEVFVKPMLAAAVAGGLLGLLDIDAVSLPLLLLLVAGYLLLYLAFAAFSRQIRKHELAVLLDAIRPAPARS